MNMKQEIKRLETIRAKVFMMYSYTEGINEDLSKRALIDMLKHISLDIESVTDYIADEIGLLERSVNWTLDLLRISLQANTRKCYLLMAMMMQF